MPISIAISHFKSDGSLITNFDHFKIIEINLAMKYYFTYGSGNWLLTLKCIVN